MPGREVPEREASWMSCLTVYSFVPVPIALFASPMAFGDHEGVRLGGVGAIGRRCGLHLDAVQPFRTSTIAATMVQNSSREHEPKHPAQGPGSLPRVGDLAIWVLRPLSG